jgi:hypothetical protein
MLISINVLFALNGTAYSMPVYLSSFWYPFDRAPFGVLGSVFASLWQHDARRHPGAGLAANRPSAGGRALTARKSLFGLSRLLRQE